MIKIKKSLCCISLCYVFLTTANAHSVSITFVNQVPAFNVKTHPELMFTDLPTIISHATFSNRDVIDMSYSGTALITPGAHYYDPKGPWRKVYSAFGGIGIYKRASIKGCRYSEVVTHDLEFLVSQWIEQAKPNTFLLSRYQQLLASSMIIDLYSDRMTPTERLTYPETLGIRLFNQYGLGKVVWFSCKSKYNLPLTCEHVPFHASMIRNGHDKLFINPKICSNPAR